MLFIAIAGFHPVGGGGGGGGGGQKEERRKKGKEREIVGGERVFFLRCSEQDEN